MLAENPAAFLADFGSPALYESSRGVQAAMVILDRPDEELLEGRVQSTAYRIEYPRGSLRGLSNAEVLTIGVGEGWSFDASGVALVYGGCAPDPRPQRFRVLGEPKQLDDGAFLEARLERL